MDKREFLKTMSLMGIAATPFFKQVGQWVSEIEHIPDSDLASNEEFWAKIRSGYRLKPDYINLENGYYCMQPEATLEHFLNHVREINYQASYYMRTVQWENKDRVAEKLANLMGAHNDEVVVTRNTTESLDLVIGGIHWKPGDEAVMANQDYGAMLDMFRLQSERHGINNIRIDVPMHPKNDSEIVDVYANAITPKTKLLMVCHMINITGHILPIRKIVDMAHSKGVDVMVDGAHAYGHIDFNIKDLNCDYYGSSLHKWLSVPLGAGLLYVKKEKIKNVWPLFAETPKEPNDIKRLNHIGTHPVHTDLAIENAIDYHNMIGSKRKEERLRFIQHYWTSRVRDYKNVVVNTPKEQHRHAGIGNVGIKGMKPADMAKTLLEKYKIWTVAIDGVGVHGCRITPNVYTTTKELDTFINAIKEMADQV
jgi:selenocysteine lyase/cysteine desulfurase